MTRILVQIPCLNEEANIGQVIKSIPRSISGSERVEILVIDDASEDETVRRAKESGADYIIRKKTTRGLAHSFRLGQLFFLKMNYDILVNTDGDNQYFQERISDLVMPILNGKADLVIGDRAPGKLAHFSFLKQRLQRLGSAVVSFASRARISDAASGFRAYSRVAMARIFITTNFSYAMESIIQAGNKNLSIQSIETGAKEVARPSRLFSSSLEHIVKSSAAIFKSFMMYRPMSIFFTSGLLVLVMGLVPMIRYLFLIASNQAGDHLQSLILGSTLVTAAVIVMVLGLVAELSRIHRQLFEEEQSLARMSINGELNDLVALFGADLVFPVSRNGHGSIPRQN